VFPTRTRRGITAALAGLIGAGALFAAAWTMPSADAAQSVAIHRHHAKSQQPIRVVTANVDWALRAQRVAQDLHRIEARADVLLLQETKNVNVDALLGPQWTVLQDTSSASRAGSTIAYRNSFIRAGRFSLRLGVEPHGAAMLPRWIATARLRVAGSYSIRVASAHRPPPRYSWLWPAFDQNMRAFSQDVKAPLIVGADWNSPIVRDPAGLRRTGARTTGAEIDGFAVDRSLRVSRVHALPKGWSDHHAVLAVIGPRR
jgi:endonuclease/exonuclease/phosphatase family metal-dependent hydrolase